MATAAPITGNLTETPSALLDEASCCIDQAMGIVDMFLSLHETDKLSISERDALYGASAILARGNQLLQRGYSGFLKARH